MKKKILILLFTIFAAGFINVNKVYANSMSIECDDTTIGVGETTNCTVKGTVDEAFMSVTAALGSDNHLEIIESSIRNVSPFGGTTHIYYIDGTTAQAGSYDFTTFTVRGLSKGSGVLTLRARTDEEPLGYANASMTLIMEVPDFNYPITVGGEDPQPVSHDSTLANLVPNEGELFPNFTSDNTVYSLNTDFTRAGRITFTATKNNDYASVGNTTCDIPNSTSIESVTCNIVVTAQDTTTTTVYSIVIYNTAYVEPPVTNDIYLNSLSYDVSGILVPDFVKTTFEYEMSINFSNYREVNFIVEPSEEGITITGKKCAIPSNPNIQSVTCNIHLTKNEKSANYKIVLRNSNSPDDKCDLIIKSNVYTIDETRGIIKVNSEHSLDTIRANLYSSCGEIKVFQDVVVITDGVNLREYKLERLIIPQTGNKKFIYLLAFASVLVIIGVFMISKKVLFKKEN